MELYFKFKSAKDYESLSIDWHYTTLADLKRNIYYTKCSGKRRTHYKDNLIVTNAQTNEEYLDGETLIPKNTSVIIRRVPWPHCMPIVITPVADQDKPLAENKLQDVQATKNSFSGGDSSVSIYPDESEWDELWNDLSMPEVVQVQGAPPNKSDEDSKIRALIDSPAMDWQCDNTDSFGAHRGFEPGIGGRSDRRGFGRGVLLEQITPPSGYICHRCKVPGHFIQHCPTNGDPTFDIKRIKPQTGIPKSMLMATSDGLRSGGGAVLKPNKAAFEKEIEGMPSTCSVVDLPAELYCPLCRKVMKDAVLVSKCCFKSFCDKCIRDYIISKSLCFCGATNVLADDLLPNKTLRATIVRILESNNSSEAISGSSLQPQGMESARCPQPKIPCPNVLSPTLSATSKEDVLALKEDVLALKSEGNAKVPVTIDNNTQKILGIVTVEKSTEVSETAQECAKEPGSQLCPPVIDEDRQQKQVSGGVGKKNKKEGAYLQLRSHQDFAAKNYLMPVEPFGYNPYWNSMKPEIAGQRPYGGQMPFMGYGLGPASIPFGGAFHHDPFGAQVYMPFPPQRDLAEHGTDFNGGGGRDMINHEDIPSAKSQTKSITPPDCHQPRARSGRRSPDHITQVPELLRSSSKRKVKYEHPHQHGEKEHRHYHQSESVSSKPPTNKTISDRIHNAGVFSRITSPEEDSTASKKRKLDSSSPSAVNRSSHHRSHRMTSNRYHEDHRKNAAAEHNYESRDDDRHFKRRRSRYESSPSPSVEEGRHSRRGLRKKGVIAASIGRLHVY